MPVPWDKREAIGELTKATLAHDEAAITQAWHRMTEAQTNAIYGVFAAQLLPILNDIRVLFKAIGALDASTKRIGNQYREDAANHAQILSLIATYEADIAARIAALEARLPERRQGDSSHEEERRVGE
jgi:hypothetical protein